LYNYAHPVPQRDKEVLLNHLVSANAADYVPEIQVDVGFTTPVEKLSAAQTLNAQIQTADWLKEITNDDDTIVDKAQEHKAADAFSALLHDIPEAKDKLLTMQVPEEIRSTVAMVSAYQWKFLEQAENLRNMAVTKIVQETDHPDARIRLKALELLGKVTEVALFTDRVEVKHTEMTDDELTQKIRDKLSRYMGKVDVVDVRMVDDIEDAPEEKQ
jgi:hypothetical protein